jgi:hypothetical protein
MRKYMTREQAAASKEKAARFVEDVLNDPDHADTIRDEPLDDWIERKRIQTVKNPSRVIPQSNNRRGTMPTKEQLQKRVSELEEENDDLQDQLDQVFDIVASPEDEDGDDDGEDEDEDDDSGNQ